MIIELFEQVTRPPLPALSVVARILLAKVRYIILHIRENRIWRKITLISEAILSYARTKLSCTLLIDHILSNYHLISGLSVWEVLHIFFKVSAVAYIRVPLEIHYMHYYLFKLLRSSTMHTTELITAITRLSQCQVKKKLCFGQFTLHANTRSAMKSFVIKTVLPPLLAPFAPSRLFYFQSYPSSTMTAMLLGSCLIFQMCSVAQCSIGNFSG